MSGWIKLHRKMKDWGWITCPKTSHLFMVILLRANYKETKWRSELIKPGQLLTGLNQLSLWSGLSVRSVRTALDHLLSTGEVTRKTTSKYSVITVTNWELYQIIDTPIVESDRQPCTSSDKRPTTSKKVKKEKKKEVELLTFLCSSMQQFVSSITPVTKQKWIDTYKQDFLIKEIGLAYEWNFSRPSGKQKKNIGTFLSNWFDNSYDTDKLIKQKREKWEQILIDNQKEANKEWGIEDGNSILA